MLLSVIYSVYFIADPLLLFVANAMFGPRSWIGGLFSRNHRRSGSTQFLDYTLTPIQVIRFSSVSLYVYCVYVCVIVE